MRNKWMKFPTLAVAALSMVLWSCDNLSEPGAGVSGPNKNLLGVEVDGTSASATTSLVAYRPLKGVFNGLTRSDSRVIQPTSGGSVGVAGNSIDVPAGAVSQPTLFKMTLAPVEVDGKTKLQVDLRAYQKDALGNYTVDVGANGFLKPIRLRMSYDWATDPIASETLLSIVWMKNDGSQQIYASTVNPNGRTVSTTLSHFSDYAVGFPNSGTMTD